MERIARIYTAPATASARLDYRFFKRQDMAETKADGPNLNRSGMDKVLERFCGEGTAGFSSAPIAVVVVDSRLTLKARGRPRRSHQCGFSASTKMAAR